MTTEIETGVGIPEEKPKRTRARRQASTTNKAKTANPASGLVDALKFLSACQKKTGPNNVQHCMLTGGWACASDGILTIGAKVEEEMNVCPNTLQLLTALSKIGEGVSMTAQPHMLTVQSGTFRAQVPCVGFDQVPITAPDPLCATLDDRLKAALAHASLFATEGSPQAFMAGVLLQANSAVSTNGHAIIEAWHGIDLPPNLLMPKASAVAIAKCKRELTGFGFSQSSATFYFGEWFIKTQLFAERFPAAYSDTMNDNGEPQWPIAANFFEAVKTIANFSENENVYFKDGAIVSHLEAERASSVELEGFVKPMGFNSKYLLALESIAESIVFASKDKIVYYGKNVRGAIMGLRLQDAAEAIRVRTGQHYGVRSGPTPPYDEDDDIPF